MRTILTLLSIAVAFILFGVLQGINAGFGRTIAEAHLDRLIAYNLGMGPLPLAALQQIEALPGVSRVAYAGQPLFGTYQEPTNFVFSLPVDANRFLDIYPEILLPAAQREALLSTRTGAVVGIQLVEKYGWKIGDCVPLTTRTARKDGSMDWTFDIVGIFSEPQQHRLKRGLIFNYDYYDEVRAQNNGMVGQYQISIKDPTEAAAIVAAVDGLFENSAYQTTTMTERESAESQLAFLTGNTMMQSVRERIGEFAVLKTLGFSNRAVTGIVVAEGLLMCAFGAALGLAVAAVLYPAVSANMMGVGYLSGTVVAAGAVAAVIVAIVSSLPPALRVNRLQIIDALSGR